MPESPDAFDELRQLAQSLEARGVASAQVIDALFRLWMRASVRLAGPEGVADTLRSMIGVFAAKAAEDIDAPPTAH